MTSSSTGDGSPRRASSRSTSRGRQTTTSRLRSPGTRARRRPPASRARLPSSRGPSSSTTRRSQPAAVARILVPPGEDLRVKAPAGSEGSVGRENGSSGGAGLLPAKQLPSAGRQIDGLARIDVENPACGPDVAVHQQTPAHVSEPATLSRATGVARPPGADRALPDTAFVRRANAEISPRLDPLRSVTVGNRRPPAQARHSDLAVPDHLTPVLDLLAAARALDRTDRTAGPVLCGHGDTSPEYS